VIISQDPQHSSLVLQSETTESAVNRSHESNRRIHLVKYYRSKRTIEPDKFRLGGNRAYVLTPTNKEKRKFFQRKSAAPIL